MVTFFGLPDREENPFMVKYSKEQRDRAVDLYIRYERCAADVIHELGYPSRGMLPVWYRGRLEEERTGRQSTRGKRYRRYTDEQRQAAVEHYLGHGRRLKRTMRALGHPKSHEPLTAWIDELVPGRRRLRHGPVPEESKREAVVAVASGRLKSRGAAAELGVGASVVRNRKRQMLAVSKEAHVTETPGEKPPTAGEGKTGAEPLTPATMPTAASGPRDAAGLADAVAASEKRPAETRPVWTSWTPTSSGSGGIRGNRTSRSRSAVGRRSRWEKSRAQSRKT